MLLALDFESHEGRPLPPTPQTLFKRFEISPQEKGQVLRLSGTLLGKARGAETILLAAITTKWRSLILLGAGTVVDVNGRLVFTRPMAVWHHLQRMHKYSAKRRALQARVAR